ncbi:MFS transporter [Sulfobacillus thermotolerans]|uniref:MFS transporter n=1 Tax=Sulfobacillus thermotolerans TaxID=338644 RepID=A0ABM6RR18_9FIRM|nr:MFS transporter [Sulfobacillus thermotolerans]
MILLSSDNGRLLWPYAFFAFTLGWGWFVLAPLVPYLIGTFHVSLAMILLLISLYGYAMIVGALPAGYWVAKSGPQAPLYGSIVLTIVGLALRAGASSFTLALMGQVVAALAYPLLIAPIGSVLRLGGVRQLKMGTGLVIGMLFLGMAAGSFIGPDMSPVVDLWMAVVLNVVTGLWLLSQLRATRKSPGVSVGKTRLIVSWWWVIGFVVASISVMFGSVSTSALLHLHVPDAAALGGMLSGLTFLGSAIGAILFGWLGENPASVRRLPRLLGVLTLVFLFLSGLLLTGGLSASTAGLDASFFLFGLFSNGWYTLALEAAAEKARTRHNAGIATAGFSMASNIGVALIPVIVGPLVITHAAVWMAVILVMGVGAAIVPFAVKAYAASNNQQRTA